MSHCGYTSREFSELPGIDAYLDPEVHAESKSMVLARYRTDMLLQAIEQDVVINEGRRKRK